MSKFPKPPKTTVWQQRLCDSVFEHNLAKAESILKDHPRSAQGSFNGGFTPLMLSVQCQDEAMFKFLLPHSDLTAVTTRGYSVYHGAAYHSQLSFLQILEPRMDPLALTHDGYSALHLALTQSANAETIAYLLPRSDLTLLVDGQSILTTAIHRSQFGMMTLKAYVDRHGIDMKTLDFLISTHPKKKEIVTHLKELRHVTQEQLELSQMLTRPLKRIPAG